MIAILIFAVIFLSLGTHNPLLANSIQWLATNNSLGVVSVFREWARILIFLPALFIFLIFISLGEFKKSTFLSTFIPLVFASLIFLNLLTSPVIPNYLYNYYKPVEMPNELTSLAQNTSPNSKLVWLSPINRVQLNGLDMAAWNESKSATQLLESNIGSQYGNPILGQPLVARYLEEKEASEQFLKALGINAIIKRKDISTDGKPQFMIYKDLTKFDQNEYYDIKKLSDEPIQAYLIENPSYLIDTTRDIQNWDALFKAEYDAYAVEKRVESADNFLLLDSRSDILAPLLDRFSKETHYPTISPASLSTINAPDIGWAFGGTDNLLHNEFNTFLNQYGIPNYQDDYGKDVLFTRAEPKINYPSQHETIPFLTHDFSDSSNVKFFARVNSIEQFGATQTISSDSDSIIFSLQQSTSGWKTIRTPYIATSTGTMWQAKLKLSLKNVYEPHIKASFYDKNRQLLETKYLTSIVDYQEEVPFEVNVNIYTSKAGAKYVQLEIWHGDNTPKQLPNIIKLNSIDFYDYSEYVEYPTVSGRLDINGKYVAYARYLFSPISGEFGVTLGSQTFNLPTYDQDTYFSWEKIGEVDIKANNSLRIFNISGFNAINQIILIPKDEAVALQAATLKQELNKYSGIIYKLSPSDRFSLKTTQLISGKYTILGNNFSQVYINGFPQSTRRITVDKNSSAYSLSEQPIFLVPERLASKVDLKNVINLNSNSPIKWSGVVDINSSNSLIIFNESYSPNWVLKVDGESTQPISISTLTNGYIQLPQGSHEVEFNFNGGALITLLKIMSYLFFAGFGLVALVAYLKKK
ncbi:MAG: hypothetical protein Fur003_3380 [Candidatus Dojkabacteria bacterium]